MTAETGYMGFVGVTTSSSSIMTIFPKWARALGLPTDRLISHDIPLGAPPEVYRDIVESIRRDPLHYGCLVTTHKMAVFKNAFDLFDGMDELAETFQEVSSISKRGSSLLGAAKDPITVRVALEEFLDTDHFSRTGGHALILGSGGAGSALSYTLGIREDIPERIISTARSQENLDHLRELHNRAGIPPTRVQYVLVRSDEADALVAALPEGSLVVNATGMGKDRPGSPLGDDVLFPQHAVVWEFNYRGSLEFLHQARAQATLRGLDVQDGWRYFIHGWTKVIADVFDIPMPPALVDDLAQMADSTR